MTALCTGWMSSYCRYPVRVMNRLLIAVLCYLSFSFRMNEGDVLMMLPIYAFLSFFANTLCCVVVLGCEE
ncbi:hypothetical protein F4678DRAFT_447013 [Xylaria arbuscula]|nr:hypothetical protein F4678DRAFT_447013 [Xylaria arbuscula]